MAAGTPRVGIFVIGAQKAGTTSLYGYLRQHPGLAAARVKETHFFDDESLDWADPPYDRLHAWFDPAPAATQYFEATPITIFWPPALARIRRYNPAARLILLLRDPIERAYSHWAMEYRRGAEALPFAEAIRAGRYRLPPHAPLAPAWREFSYVERGLYADQVRRALALFPQRQLLCLDTAALRADHAGSLARISDFLGLPPFPPLAPRLDHSAPPGPGLTPADTAWLREIFAPDVRALAALTGLQLDDWLTLRSA
ncbi:sulfotransferase domain-containing protein [Roseomonas soli]|uniref:Sulfotransferase domain-containing protein n=1 Tax=Neoroseomonas soli TaxID=1081025 RepID=A0A9X9X349_9PROT|nr:sulfotransferase domain-containing protein [Neoroseomonas soli]